MITKKELHDKFYRYQCNHGRTTSVRIHLCTSSDGKSHYAGWIGDLWRGWVEMALEMEIIDPAILSNHDLSLD